VADGKVDWKAVGRRVRELRGLYTKQKDFAKSVGVSQNYLSVIEHGKAEVGAAVLLRIGRVGGKSLEWLLTGDERES
jgi:transcriptional regulator with XRE-family HTH domain